MQNADEIIKALEMQRHSREGGYFRETFRSIVKTEATKQRRAGTSILYLLKGMEVSRWHQVRSDEIWMYHAGSTARQILLFPDGSWAERIIGPDILSGEMPQSLIPAWTWQATALSDRSGDSWGLFGAVVVPGFEYEDFKEGAAGDLILKYPDAEESIRDAGLFI
ncbi:MAG: cupin domain-containing protein [Victivallales bacterium]